MFKSLRLDDDDDDDDAPSAVYFHIITQVFFPFHLSSDCRAELRLLSRFFASVNCVSLVITRTGS